MTQPETEVISYAKRMMPSERRVAVLGLLQRSGKLTYWGPKDGCYLIERNGKEETLTPADVDWMEFVEFARAMESNS